MSASRRNSGRARELSETCITFYVAQKGTPASGEPVPPEFPLLYEDGSRERRILTDVCELGGRPRGFNMRGGNVVIGADNEHGRSASSSSAAIATCS